MTVVLNVFGNDYFDRPDPVIKFYILVRSLMVVYDVYQLNEHLHRAADLLNECMQNNRTVPPAEKGFLMNVLEKAGMMQLLRG